MRTILFRGFCISDKGNDTICFNDKKLRGYWVYWDKYGALEHTLTHKDLSLYVHISDLTENNLIPETVAEFIGLYDKYKKPIFEDDFVKNIDNTIYQIKWIDYEWEAVESVENGNYFAINARYLKSCRVIANIHNAPITINLKAE